MAAAEEQRGSAELLRFMRSSIYSHLARGQNIKEKFGGEITFPIIKDLSMGVAAAYGMIHPGASNTSAVRATFIIGDKGFLQVMIYCPMTNGRIVPEVLRIVRALQTSLTHEIVTPEAWQPGDKVIVGSPKTKAEVEKRLTEGSRPRIAISPSRISPSHRLTVPSGSTMQSNLRAVLRREEIRSR